MGDSRPRIDWKIEREQVDLASLAGQLLGEAPGRRGERGRHLWWNCPFHQDPNPSFYIEPGKPWWKCLGCGERGDAASLLMRLEGMDFRDAVQHLMGEPVQEFRYRPAPRPEKPPETSGPRGLPESRALALVKDAEARLWTDAGAEALASLTQERRLNPETIRRARLGWTPGVEIPTQDGKTFVARGVVIPWFGPDRLELVKIRQPGDARPKYAEAFRDRPEVLAGSELDQPGLPLIVTEGEFDALLLGQDLAGLAVMVTLGSASARPDGPTLARFLSQTPWYVATDADEAGDRAAQAWPRASRRVRPPGAFNDWTEARQGGVDLRRWWTDRLGGALDPALFTWADLVDRRWGPAVGNPEPGIVIDQPDPERRRLALLSLGSDPGESAEASSRDQDGLPGHPGTVLSRGFPPEA